MDLIATNLLKNKIFNTSFKKGGVMKKLLGCFLCVMLLGFLATPCTATIFLVTDVDVGGTPDLTDQNSTYWKGSDQNPQGKDIAPYTRLNNSNPTTEEAWLEALLGLVYDDPSVNFFDKIENPLGGPKALNNYDPGFNWEYTVVKWGDNWSAFGNDGNRLITWEFDKGVSHATFFNGSPVPEPATMLLLGSGIVGLAGFGRKKFKK
jgi:hypothetical protein